MLARSSLSLLAAAVLVTGLGACASENDDAALALCRDPHNTGGGAGIQPCVRNSDCRVCGSGWQCWNGQGQDDNCHTHSPGTPWVSDATQADE